MLAVLTDKLEEMRCPFDYRIFCLVCPIQDKRVSFYSEIYRYTDCVGEINGVTFYSEGNVLIVLIYPDALQFFFCQGIFLDRLCLLAL